MIKVKARGNESLEQMLRRFKKMCEKEGLTKEIKAHELLREAERASSSSNPQVRQAQ